MRTSDPNPPSTTLEEVDSRARATTDARRRWDKNAAFYNAFQWPMEVMVMGSSRRRLISHVRGPRVLEVGVGTGQNLPLYAPGIHVDGIDFSGRMIERARRRKSAASVTLHEMDAQQMAFPDAIFDTVVSTCVFCSVPDPVRGLSEVRRVLRPDGWAVFLEHMRPDGRWLGPLFDRLDPIVSRRGPHINRRTLDNIAAAGLRIEHARDLTPAFVKIVVARV